MNPLHHSASVPGFEPQTMLMRGPVAAVHPVRQPRGWNRQTLLALALGLAVLLAFGLWYASREPAAPARGELVTRADRSGSLALGNGRVVGTATQRVTAGSLMRDPGAYFGSDATILEEVEIRVGSSGFTLGGDTRGMTIPVVGATRQRLVRGSQGGADMAATLVRARVTGRVVRFDQARFAREFDPAWAESRWSSLQGGAAIVATRVDIDPTNDGGPGEDNGPDDAMPGS